jgi:hypothetical protein
MTSLFINPKPNGYAVELARVDTPVHVASTQEEAITWAQVNYPDAAVHVARVRHLSDKRNPDHWRKI